MGEQETLDKIAGHLSALDRAIDHSVENNLVLPALILIFTGIDVLASLERREGEGTQKSFVRWADTYLVPQGLPDCSGIDLYGARCGVLHSFAAESCLSRSGKAKPVHYAWGTADPKDMLQVDRAINRGTFIVIHVSELRSAFHAARIAYFDQVAKDDARVGSVLKNAGTLWLTDVPVHLIKKALENISKDPTA